MSAAGLVAQGMAPTESPPAESSYGREISDADVARFIEDGVRRFDFACCRCVTAVLPQAAPPATSVVECSLSRSNLIRTRVRACS